MHFTVKQADSQADDDPKDVDPRSIGNKRLTDFGPIHSFQLSKRVMTKNFK
jgi:hypothetical protein